jgi:BTB And C-terminal Kelch/BTB/POZ domain
MAGSDFGTEELLNGIRALDVAEPAYYDLKIIADDGEVRCHSLLFSIFSPVFAKIAAEAAKPAEMRFDGYSCDNIVALRKFFYTGKLSLTADNACRMLELAKQYDITSLRSVGEIEIVARLINASTAFQILESSQKAESPSVEGAAKSYIRANTAACVASIGFLSLTLENMLSLLKDDSLSIREEDLFRRVLKWVDANAQKIENTYASEKKVLSRNDLLSLVIPFIRFPVMGAQVFARTVVPADVLTTDETTSILMGFIVPDVAASSKFNSHPRNNSGSLYTWSNNNVLAKLSVNNAKAIVSLSDDSRVVHFRHLQSHDIASSAFAEPDTLLITEQAFAAGISTLYVTVWGAAHVIVGAVTSQSNVDDGDAPSIASAGAFIQSDRFEGVTMSTNGEIKPSTHSSAFQVTGMTPIKDGTTLAITLDWDERTVAIAIYPVKSARTTAVPACKLLKLPAVPWRLAFGAIARPSAGDIDGIAQISSQPPQGTVSTAVFSS